MEYPNTKSTSLYCILSEIRFQFAGQKALFTPLQLLIAPLSVSHTQFTILSEERRHAFILSRVPT